MKKVFPSIDYFDQEFVDLFAKSWHVVARDWNNLPLVVQLAIHPYCNGEFTIKYNSREPLVSYPQWAIFHWFNRVGDRKAMVRLMGAAGESDHPLSLLTKYTVECIDGKYDTSFALKRDFYTRKRRINATWIESMGTYVGSTMLNAEYLLAEIPTPEQARALWDKMQPRFAEMGALHFYALMKGFEKYGYISEVRQAVISKIYGMLDGDLCNPYDLLITITLMIENVIGMQISDWRRVVDWFIPQPEFLAVKHLVFRNNPLTAVVHHPRDRWVVSIRSERNFAITLNPVGYKRATYLMPIGRCSIPL